MGESVTPAVEMNEWPTYYITGLEQFVKRGVSDDPFYLISNHLSSTSLMVAAIGQEASFYACFLIPISLPPNCFIILITMNLKMDYGRHDLDLTFSDDVDAFLAWDTSPRLTASHPARGVPWRGIGTRI